MSKLENILTYQGIQPKIDKNTFIAPNAFIIGDVEIGEDTNIWFNTTIRGDVHEIRIGKRTNIQDGTVVHVSQDIHGTYIGDDVTIGHSAIIHACTLGNMSFVGMQACVMDEAVIEDKAMLAAGALLTPKKVIPSGELWAGRPAKFMRKLTDEELAHLEWSANHYVTLSKRYL